MIFVWKYVLLSHKNIDTSSKHKREHKIIMCVEQLQERTQPSSHELFPHIAKKPFCIYAVYMLNYTQQISSLVFLSLSFFELVNLYSQTCTTQQRLRQKCAIWIKEKLWCTKETATQSLQYSYFNIFFTPFFSKKNIFDN